MLVVTKTKAMSDKFLYLTQIGLDTLQLARHLGFDDAWLSDIELSVVLEEVTLIS